MEIAETITHPTCKDLAHYLELRKETILTSWLREAASDPIIPSDALTRLEVLDHVPQMFDAMTLALRRHCSDAAMDNVQNVASRHTIVRWIQQYDLRAVLREVSFLRKEFVHHLALFDEQLTDLSSPARIFNAQTVHGILDDIVMEATSTYLSLKDRGEA